MRGLSLSAADRTATAQVYQHGEVPCAEPDPRPPQRRYARRVSHLIDLSPFRQSPAFARMWIGSTLSGIGGQLTVVTVMLHVFELTQSTFAVSMIAVAGLVPMILAGLYGGMLADAFDRRRVALIAAVITFAATALLATLTWTHRETIWWLYALSMIIAAANSVGMATRTAIVPRLLPRELLAPASALNGVAFGMTVMAGPALAGVLVALTGYGWTYTIDVILMLSMFLGLWTLPALKPEGEIVRPGLASLVDGWRFLRRAGNIRMQYILDICAMTFGQRDGAPFFHAHALWAEGAGKRSGGHILPDETTVAETITLEAIGLDGAVFTAEPDGETHFKLFGPVAEASGGPGAGRFFALRVKPNVDFCGALEAFCAERGIREAMIHGGVGSTIGARFVDGSVVENFATEVAIMDGRIVSGAGGLEAAIDVALVDYSGARASGRLKRGDNPVLMTFELVLEAR